jgi:GNAT superfamily N-acetyltransferase
MTAFDRAWDLVKMPIVPGSLRETDEGFNADFIDPYSNEQLLMVATPDKMTDGLGGQMRTTIEDPEWQHMNGMERAIQVITDKPTSNHLTGKIRVGPFWPHSSFTSPEYRRRGYATAIYEMVSAILDRKGGHTLAPANQLSDAARGLWGDKGMDDTWPVRDDL